MPDLAFKVVGVEPAMRGLTPLLKFRVDIANEPPGESIHTVMLQAQIQIQSPQREYNAREREKLTELFGPPSQWAQTLRNRLWTTTSTIVSAFAGNTTAHLPVQCTYDLNIAATKYLYALEEGDVPLLFLFSGTIFYVTEEGRLQVQQISWSKEATYRMPVAAWQEMMDDHYPNSAWLYMNRDVFDQLYAFKRQQRLPTWEQTIERLLSLPSNRQEAAV